MQIGLFNNSISPLQELMLDLSKELNFDLITISSLEDKAISNVDGLIVSDEFKSSADIAHTLKRFKNILFLNPDVASTILTKDLSIICEEAEVELQIAGPAIHPQIFNFIAKNSTTPYYVRVIKEIRSLGEISFNTLYRLLYWCAFFSEGDVRKFKMNVSPAISTDGILLYGRTESALSVPVDIWFTNLGFEDKEVVKVFTQTEVLDLDCQQNILMAKNKDGEAIESYEPVVHSGEVYIRSFVEHLQKKGAKPHNLALAKFLKMVEFYDSMKRSINL